METAGEGGNAGGRMMPRRCRSWSKGGPQTLVPGPPQSHPGRALRQPQEGCLLLYLDLTASKVWGPEGREEKAPTHGKTVEPGVGTGLELHPEGCGSGGSAARVRTPHSALSARGPTYLLQTSLASEGNDLPRGRVASHTNAHPSHGLW